MFDFSKLAVGLSSLMMPGGNQEEKIMKLVSSFVTPDNVAKVAANLITGLQELQQKHGLHYVLTIESTTDGKDICIRIYNRDANAQMHIVRVLMVSQITANDINELITILRNGNK